MTPPRLLTALLASGALLTACSTGTDAAGSTSSAVATSGAPASTSDPAAATGWGSLEGCPATGDEIGSPDGASQAPTVDVDGDGAPDTAWIDDETDVGGGVPFGIETAAGGEFFENFASAAPGGRAVLFADVTGDGEVVALAGDGRAVQLWAVSRCGLVPVENAQGEQYTFDLGFTGQGTGVGCTDADGDGTTDLVGLQLDGDTVRRTIITLDGPDATNGATDEVAATDPSVADATGVTCGDLTLAADGVALAG